MIKENNKHSVLPKGNGMENNEYMSHEVSYWWLKENPIYNINRFVLQECGDFTWRVPDCEELVGVTWSSSDPVKN